MSQIRSEQYISDATTALEKLPIPPPVPMVVAEPLGIAISYATTR